MNYPLSEHDSDGIRAKSGKRLEEITLEAVTAGKINADDIKISVDVLQKQSGVAENAGRRQQAENLMRASELVNIPDDVILSMYNKLRPNRSTKQELQQMADELRDKYNAVQCSELMTEALHIYEQRGVLL